MPTTNVLAAGADDISAVMAAMFGAHAQQYQAMGAQAANLHAQFVQAMKAASSAYIDAEAANASPLNLVEQATQRVAAFSTAGPHNRLVPTTSRSAYRAFGAGGPGGVGKLGAA
ncbi:hypothetical protein A5634_20720 [Mycobacterium asiaticum]|uniref:PE domain-containing protein n=1 Tax=Mycobacterium asiaticum TaxID=1790 RepID=A0A1A3P256_MYCAS|nr:hypothetical protein A5634_20720 [Mycobacterium asiaticum]